MSVKRETLDRLLLALLFDRVENVTKLPVKPRKTRTNEIHYADEVRRYEAQLDELATDRAEGVMSRREWLVAKTIVEEKRDAALTELAREDSGAVAVKLRGTNVKRDWDSKTFDEQRWIVTNVFGKVPIGPAVRQGYTPDEAERVRRVAERIDVDSDGFWKL